MLDKFMAVLRGDAPAETVTMRTAVIELNRRQMPGAQHSLWVALAMSGGELVLSHVNTMNRLEELILKKPKCWELRQYGPYHYLER